MALQTSALLKDLVEDLELAAIVGILVSPDAQRRPDGVLILRETEGIRCALIVGVAVFSESATATKAVSQIASTVMSSAQLVQQ